LQSVILFKQNTRLGLSDTSCKHDFSFTPKQTSWMQQTFVN